MRESSSAFMDTRCEGGERWGDVLRPRWLAMAVVLLSCYRDIVMGRGMEEVCCLSQYSGGSHAVKVGVGELESRAELHHPHKHTGRSADPGCFCLQCPTSPG